MNNYKVITLCGSTKFKKEYELVNKFLTFAGHTVITVSCFGHADKIELTSKDKEILDAVHKRKIGISNAIVVIDVGGYIGESTLSEIRLANSLGIDVYYYKNGSYLDLQ